VDAGLGRDLQKCYGVYGPKSMSNVLGVLSTCLY